MKGFAFTYGAPIDLFAVKPQKQGRIVEITGPAVLLASSDEGLELLGDDPPLLSIAALLGALGCAAGAVALAKHHGRKNDNDDSDEEAVEK